MQLSYLCTSIVMRGRRSHWDIFVVLVQQPVVCLDQKLLCTLLAVSTSVRELILDSCKGQALISFKALDLKHVRRFCLWLQSHGQLVTELAWQWMPDVDTTIDTLQAAEATIAAALQTAASKQPLHIQSYSCNPGTGALQLAVLKHLPSSTVTRVDIRLPGAWVRSWPLNKKFKCTWQGILKGADTGLAGLTKLRDLKLQTNTSSSLNKFAQQMTSLTALTSLSITGDDVSVQVLKHLPSSVVVLDTPISEDITADSASSKSRSSAHLTISHLTALTKLTIYGTYTIGPKDKLPPHTVDLQLSCWGATVQPLLSLRKLERLELKSSCMLQSAELKQLSGRATGLTHLSLEYLAHHKRTSNLDKESRCWPSLPIKQLAMTGLDISAAAGQRLAALGHQGLTSLELCHCACDEMPRTVAKYVQQMTQLRHLKLVGLFEVHGTDGCLAGTRNVLQAIAHLPKLRSLCIQQMKLQGLARELVNKKQGLQHLVLESCQLNYPAVEVIMNNCVHLRDLDLSYNREVTYRAFEPVKEWKISFGYKAKPSPLVHLTSLDLLCTRVTLKEARHIKKQVTSLATVRVWSNGIALA